MGHTILSSTTGLQILGSINGSYYQQLTVISQPFRQLLNKYTLLNLLNAKVIIRSLQNG